LIRRVGAKSVLGFVLMPITILALFTTGRTALGLSGQTRFANEALWNIFVRLRQSEGGVPRP
jgi:hypothetical protein